MLRRSLLFGVAAMLVLGVSVPSRAALTVRALVVLANGQAVVLNTPTLQFTPSPGSAPIKAKVVCIEKVKTTSLNPAGNFVFTGVHAVKGSKHYYFGMGSFSSKSPVQAVVSAAIGTTPDPFPQPWDPCDISTPGLLGSAVGVAVFR